MSKDQNTNTDTNSPKQDVLPSAAAIRSLDEGYAGLSEAEAKAALKHNPEGAKRSSKNAHRLVANSMPLPTRIEMWIESKSPAAYADGALKWTLRGVAVWAMVKVVKLGLEKIGIIG